MALLFDLIRAPRKRASSTLLSKILSSSLLCTSILIVSVAPLAMCQIAWAQELRQTDPNAQLLLKADQLIYDNDNQIVTATGNVQLDYDGYNVVADRVSYNQKTRRVKAYENVEILEPDGNRIYAQEIDLTDDFSEGFVNALRVETPDNTRFAAESAERFAGQKTVFNHGVYTACEPCKDDPDKAPIWQVKAKTVILDGVEKTVTYRNATFELFGAPIAYLPYFSHADPSVKRKSGFLVPRAGYDSELGFWMRQPYFLVTGESHDLTFAASGYTQQGFLGEVEWRHQLENGIYSIKVAGIDQKNPAAFNAGSSDASVTTRGMVGTRGEFKINPRWSFGWNILAQSDNNFSRTYKIKGYTASSFTNDIFLRGLYDRSFFDLSAKQYLVQNSRQINTGNAFQFESEQPTIRPVLDYNYVTTEEKLEGELTLDVNVTSLERDILASSGNLAAIPSGDFRTHGIKGDTTRVSADLAWKKTVTTNSGLMVTPSLSLRGDWTSTNGTSLAPTAVVTGVTTGTYSRFMPTAGLEVSYPILARTGTSSHVFEPIAQIYLRPDLGFSGVAPNEDAQSLVFDAATLFQRDKFSGYDRIESGTRANVGLRYSGQFQNGLSLHGLIGQSFHLSGDNPYAREDDLANVGEESGLETDRSDYVASLAVSGTTGITLNTQARFDEKDFDLNRGEISLSYQGNGYSIASNYTFIAPQPDYSALFRRQQVGFTASYNFADNWRVFTAAQYNLESQFVINKSAGLTYADECFTFTLHFSESRSGIKGNTRSRAIGFRIGLRTIGDYAGSLNDSDFDNFTQ